MNHLASHQPTDDDIKKMFEEEAKPIRQALMQLQESFNCIKYLLVSEVNSNVVDRAKKEVFFALCIENFAYSIYINLHKLYSDGQDYSFFKFIKIITAPPYTLLNLPASIVKSWRQRINDQRVLIETVGGIRNDGIAHFRKRGETSPVRYLTFEETGILIKIAQDIFKDIYFHSFGSSLTIETPINPTLDNLKRILEWYASYPHLRAEYQKLALKLEGHDTDGL